MTLKRHHSANLIAIVALAASVLLSGCATSRRFALVDKATGKTYGPFPFRHGHRVNIAGHVYGIRILASDTALTRERLRSRILPVVDFENVDIRDALDFVRDNEIRDSESLRDRPPLDVLLIVPKNKQASVPLISFRARMISVYDFLKALERMTGLKLEIGEQTVSLVYMERERQPVASSASP